MVTSAVSGGIGSVWEGYSQELPRTALLAPWHSPSDGSQFAMTRLGQLLADGTAIGVGALATTFAKRSNGNAGLAVAMVGVGYIATGVKGIIDHRAPGA